MRIKQIALAIKCFMKVLGDSRKSPRRSHSWCTVERPTVAIVNNPTHLQLTTAPRERPESVSHAHHESVKGSCLSSLQKPIQRKIVRAVKNIKGESRRMCLD